jgi:hypothetical protein
MLQMKPQRVLACTPMEDAKRFRQSDATVALGMRNNRGSGIWGVKNRMAGAGEFSEDKVGWAFIKMKDDMNSSEPDD